MTGGRVRSVLRSVEAIASRADAVDARRWSRGRPYSQGLLARSWALLKMLFVAAVFPPGVAVTFWRAAVNHAKAKAAMAGLRDLLDDVAHNRPLVGPAPRAARLHPRGPVVVTSDLHRGVPGRLDLAGRQGTRELYLAMLLHYDERSYHLIENGDVEDLWAVGGSAWGTAYDALRIVGGALPGRAGAALRSATYRAHLDRIIANHSELYETIRRRFVADGRYHRTVGNHDDAFLDGPLSRHLSDRLAGAPVVDWVTIEGDDGDARAIVTHGHLTDGWNAPGRSQLGKLSSWLADTLRDAPLFANPDDLPPPAATRRILEGGQSNRLLRVHPRYGASSSYDSLDEELLFDSVGGASDRGPWLILGHTHYPVIRPTSWSGVSWERYVNSGHGIGFGCVTAVEWDPTSSDASPVTLVAWMWADEPAWSELVPGEAVVCEHRGRPVARIELEPSPDGRRLVPTLPAPVSRAASGTR